MIYVLATSELNDGCREKFLEILKANVPNVLAEAGCVMYVPNIDFPSGLSAQGKHGSPDGTSENTAHGGVQNQSRRNAQILHAECGHSGIRKRISASENDFISRQFRPGDERTH